MAKIVRVKRDTPMFRERKLVMTSIDYKGGKYTDITIREIPIKQDLILCDVCNKEITTEYINLLCLTKKDIWGVLCEGCRIKYHKKLRINYMINGIEMSFKDAMNYIEKMKIRKLRDYEY